MHDAKPSLPLLAVNNVNDPCLASPVIAAGKLYLRTTTQLLCIPGTGGATPIITSQATVASLDELNARYTQHQAGEGEDVAIRLEIVDALSQSADVQAVAFLERIALTDNHWDVSEAAAKALGVIGRSAIPSMVTLLTKSPDYQNYLKVIAADNLGSLYALDAVPALVSATTNRDRLVRAAALRDLGDIAHVHATMRAEVVAALLKGLQDKESMVKEAALAGLVQIGDSQPTTLDAVTKLTADPNPLVVEKARKALAVLTQQQARATLEKKWYGEARATPSVEDLKAGRIPGKKLEVQLDTVETLQALERALAQISDIGSVALRETGEGRAPAAPPSREAAPAQVPAAAATTPRWFAVWTRSRHERAVFEQLTERGIEAFLPTTPRWSRWKDRKKKIEWPLFPGYCFARFEPEMPA
jgi:hypothetical protein